MDSEQVLVIEDDAATAAFLADNLRADGYAPVVVDAVGPALRALEVRPIDVVLLDVGLGEASGLDVLDVVRSADGVAARVDRDLPVIVLSGRGSEVERLRGFRRGADDYLVKPFSYPELLARMQAVLRRAAARPLRGLIRVSDLEIDPLARTVRRGGDEVHLSMREFDLLHALARQPARVDTKAWRLRNKLSGGGRPLVETVRGVGYRLLAGAA